MVAAFIMGLSPWVIANTVFAQMPIFCVELPEKAGIGAYASISIQCSAVFAFAFFAIQRGLEAPWEPRSVVSLVVILFPVVAVVIALTWKILLFGWSIPLFLGLFLAGGCGSMANMTFWAWAADYPAIVTSMMGTGISFGPVLVSVVAFLQDPGAETPLFSPRVFVLISAGLLSGPPVAFFWLSWLKDATDQQNANPKKPRQGATTGQRGISEQALYNPLVEEVGRAEEDEAAVKREAVTVEAKPALTVAWEVRSLLLHLFWAVFVVYGWLPSVLCYAVIGYPNDRELLMWLTNVSMIAPAFGSLATSIPRLRAAPLWPATAMHSLAITYITLAVFMRKPILHDSAAGAPVLVASVVCLSGFASFVMTNVFMKLQTAVTISTPIHAILTPFHAILTPINAVSMGRRWGRIGRIIT